MRYDLRKELAPAPIRKMILVLGQFSEERELVHRHVSTCCEPANEMLQAPRGRLRQSTANGGCFSELLAIQVLKLILEDMEEAHRLAVLRRRRSLVQRRLNKAQMVDDSARGPRLGISGRSTKTARILFEQAFVLWLGRRELDRL
jgi:hypothetical protein